MFNGLILPAPKLQHQHRPEHGQGGVREEQPSPLRLQPARPQGRVFKD